MRVMHGFNITARLRKLLAEPIEILNRLVPLEQVQQNAQCLAARQGLGR